MSTLIEIQQAVAKQLATTLQTAHSRAETIGPDYAELITQIQTLVLRGGKRLRPIVTVWSYQALGGQNDAAIIQAAASQELLHAAILMHDDIIDRDIHRWGGLNISGYYETFFKQSHPTKARQLGDTLALLAGDASINLSFQLLTTSDFSASKRLAGLQLMHDTFATMVGGELLDVAASLHTLSDLPPMEALLAICDYKTAQYTFSTPLALGALLAGASRSQRLTLEQLGSKLGIAYQLQDDLLGMFGDEAQTGKPILSDLREGKLTALIHYGLTHGTSSEQRTLKQLLGKSDVTTKDLEQVQNILIHSGAHSYVESYIGACYNQANDLVRTIGWQEPYARRLQSLFEQLLQRNH